MIVPYPLVFRLSYTGNIHASFSFVICLSSSLLYCPLFVLSLSVVLYWGFLLSIILLSLFYLRLLVATGVLPTRYTTGYLQRLYKLIPFSQFALSISQSFGRDVLECFRVLVSCGFFLKCFQNVSEESCDADGVYVILQNQRWGKRFEYWWSVLWEYTAFFSKDRPPVLLSLCCVHAL